MSKVDLTLNNYRRIQVLIKRGDFNHTRIRNVFPMYAEANFGFLKEHLQLIERAIPYRHSFLDTLGNVYLLEYNLNRLSPEDREAWLNTSVNTDNVDELIMPLLSRVKAKAFYKQVWADIPSKEFLQNDIRGGRVIEMMQIVRYAKLNGVIKQ